MGYLLDIMHYSMGSIFWGILMGIFFLAVFFLLIKGFYKDAEFNPATYITGTVLGILLMIQCILVCGSLSILSLVNDYEILLTNLVATLHMPASELVSKANASEIIDDLIAANPLLAKYISGGEFQGFTVAELPSAIAEELRSYMRWYIFRRFLWCLGFSIVAALVVVKTMGRKYDRRRRNGTRNSSRGTVGVGSGSRTLIRDTSRRRYRR